MRKVQSNLEHFIVRITDRIEKVEHNEKLTKKHEVNKLVSNEKRNIM